MFQDNIFVDNIGQPRLADFGISRMCERTLWLTTSTHAKGTARWQAPETFSGGTQSQATKASDVYSFAMTCLVSLHMHNHSSNFTRIVQEIATKKLPFSELSNDGAIW